MPNQTTAIRFCPLHHISLKLQPKLTCLFIKHGMVSTFFIRHRVMAILAFRNEKWLQKWLHEKWLHEWLQHNIATKELVSIAAVILCHCDNTAIVSAISSEADFYDVDSSVEEDHWAACIDDSGLEQSWILLKSMFAQYWATSVPSERLFSKAGELISAKRTRRNKIKPKYVDMLLLLNKNNWWPN